MSKYAIVRRYDWGQWAYATGDKFSTKQQAEEHVREYGYKDVRIIKNNAYVLQRLNFEEQWNDEG